VVLNQGPHRCNSHCTNDEHEDVAHATRALTDEEIRELIVDRHPRLEYILIEPALETPLLGQPAPVPGYGTLTHAYRLRWRRASSTTPAP
jgi:hypothetical protein